jgi:hypothetical protein
MATVLTGTWFLSMSNSNYPSYYLKLRQRQETNGLHKKLVLNKYHRLLLSVKIL